MDAIISVGYRIKSHVATHFRIWATKRLREYIVKGFALDDERMKAAGMIRYFDELTERIRDIRSSDRLFAYVAVEAKLLLCILKNIPVLRTFVWFWGCENSTKITLRCSLKL